MTTTPILAGFYPDPSICRVEDTYYLVNSSFEYLPGLPLHASTDLLTWRSLGNALARPSQIEEHEGVANGGVFAPTIRHHDGRFWIVTTNIWDLGKGRGHFILTAEDPSGPWSDPVHVPGAIGIDPDLAWDEDGTCQLTWASFLPELKGIASAPVDLATGVLLAPPRLLWQGTGLAHPEGPHLYRVDGWWYLLLAEGGTERGHCVTIARGRSLDDAFEPAPHNPILTHRSTTDPVQNVGHADLIELADGSWAAVHLGVRPRGQTPLFHGLGRETFLVGIDWVDGWPFVVEDRYLHVPVDHSFVDRFEGEHLDQRWLGAGSFPASFTTLLRPGLQVAADHRGPGKSLVACRVRDQQWSATATIDTADGAARFLVRIDDRHWYGFEVEPHGIEVVLRIGPARQTIATIDRSPGTPATLRITALPGTENSLGAVEPDLIELSVAHPDGTVHVIGAFDGRYLSTEVAGGFLGRLVGVEALSGLPVIKELSYQARTGF